MFLFFLLCTRMPRSKDIFSLLKNTLRKCMVAYVDVMFQVWGVGETEGNTRVLVTDGTLWMLGSSCISISDVSILSPFKYCQYDSFTNTEYSFKNFTILHLKSNRNEWCSRHTIIPSPSLKPSRFHQLTSGKLLVLRLECNSRYHGRMLTVFGEYQE